MRTCWLGLLLRCGSASNSIAVAVAQHSRCQDRTLDTKPVALEEFERIEGRSAAKADQHRERAKSIMVKSRASEPSPQSPPLDDDAELSDADSF